MEKIITLCRRQLTKHKLSILGILGVSLILILGVIGFCYFTGNSIKTLTKDPVSLTDLPFYSGYFSQLGNILWFIAAGISFFSYYVVDGKFRRFLFFSAIFSLILGIDDLFMLHDGLMPAIGLHENIFFVFYILFSLFYLIYFQSLIFRSAFIFLFLAFGFLGISVLWDTIKISGINPYLFEDGFKMMGIISWLVYHFKFSKKIIEKTIQKSTFQRTQELISNKNNNHLRVLQVKEN